MITLSLPERHTTLLALAMPMIVANIAQPVLGLVDTAILGHLGQTDYLAGAAVGAFVLSQIFWLCGFLRQSSTGLSAQARGAAHSRQISSDVVGGEHLVRALVLACGLGLLLIVGQSGILALIVSVTDFPALARESLITYVEIRIVNAPVALANLVTIGYLVGQQQTRAVLWLQIGVTLLNIALNVLFVYGFSLAVAGVAYATVIAEWCMLLCSVWLIVRHRRIRLAPSWWSFAAFAPMLLFNRDLFLRGLILQACLGFLTYQGAQYGVVAAAVNAILMQCFVFIALALDGIAYAIEAMIGEQAGAKSTPEHAARLWYDIRVSLLWSNVFGLALSLIMAFSFTPFVAQLTDQAAVLAALESYYWVMLCLPWLAHWCYCLDGIYIGLTRGDVMRNSMLVSALVYLGIYGVLTLTSDAGNVHLWVALLALQVMRGVTLGWHLHTRYRYIALG